MTDEIQKEFKQYEEIEQLQYIDSDGSFWDEMSHERLNQEGVIIASREERTELRKHGVHTKVNEEDCWKEASKAPIRVID